MVRIEVRRRNTGSGASLPAAQRRKGVICEQVTSTPRMRVSRANMETLGLGGNGLEGERGRLPATAPD